MRGRDKSFSSLDKAFWYDPESDLVQCLECKRWFKRIVNFHLKAHGLTPAEYKKRHGILPRTALMNKAGLESHSRQAYKLKKEGKLKSYSKGESSFPKVSSAERSKRMKELFKNKAFVENYREGLDKRSYISYQKNKYKNLDIVVHRGKARVSIVCERCGNSVLDYPFKSKSRQYCSSLCASLANLSSINQ